MVSLIMIRSFVIGYFFFSYRNEYIQKLIDEARQKKEEKLAEKGKQRNEERKLEEKEKEKKNKELEEEEGQGEIIGITPTPNEKIIN